MSLITSSHFASACAGGTDWREAAKNVLEQLNDTQTDKGYFNFGFLYISDHLADDTSSILNFFKSVLNVDHWVGSVGMGIVGGTQSMIDTPAISAMICRLPEDSFCIFPPDDEFDEHEDEDSSHATAHDSIYEWTRRNMPLLTITHGDPLSEHDLLADLSDLEKETNSFIIGGMASSRNAHYQIADTVRENMLSGALFSDAVNVATTLSQGCEPISDFHTVTKADEATILELNDRLAIDVFQDDLRRTEAKKQNVDTTQFTTDLKAIEFSDKIPAEFQNLFHAQVHIARPLLHSDQKDYMVRNINRLNADEGSISISEPISVGDRILFVERNENSLVTDLSRSLVALRKRIQSEKGEFSPKAALYISCVARGMGPSFPDEKNEIDLIREIIGPIPMTGFYAGGEINNAQLYGFTGILTLFF